MNNIAVLFLSLLISATLIAKGKNIYVGELTCEYKENPLNIEALKLRAFLETLNSCQIIK